MTKLGDITGLKNLHDSNRENLFQELCNLWKSPDALITTRCIRKGERLYFANLSNTKGEKLKYPNGKRVAEIPVPLSLKLIPSYYKVKFRLADDLKRNKSKNEYLIQIDPEFEPIPQKWISKSKSHLSKEKSHVEEIKRDYESGSERLIRLSSNMIRSIVTETNKKPETFIFELIQNADDYPDPSRNGVKIEFHIIQDYLVMVHNGLTFRENNVEAICGVDQGDKKFDLEKVGYKGMGFKSIFKFANYVWINSGRYSFRFDAEHKATKKETPWQVIPIWTEPKSQPKSLQSLLSHPVTIAIKPNQGIEKLHELMDVFKSVFKSDSRLLLFLRNVNSIKFSGFEESFAIEKSSSLWKVSNLTAVSLDDKTYSTLRFDADNDDRVPEKYKTLRQTKISFAVAHENGRIKLLDQTRLFAYLPTDLDFGFNFLINGDFIPDGSRDRLFVDVDFNLFLMRKAGYLFVNWIAELLQEIQNTTPYDLIPDINHLIDSEHDTSKKVLLGEFKNGFEQALEEIEFVLCSDNNLELLSNVLIDKTGISGILGTDGFKKRFDISKEAVHEDIKDSKWIEKLIKQKEYADGLFTWDNLVAQFSLIMGDIIDPSNNSLFLNLLAHKNKLNAFSELSTALNNEGKLSPLNSLFKEVPEKHSEIVAKLGASWIDSEVLSELEEDAVSELRAFEGLNFIQENITNKLEDVNKEIQSIETSIALFALIEEYSSELSVTTFESLKGLSYFDKDDTAVNGFNTRNSYLSNDFLTDVINSGCLPDNHFSIVSSSYEDHGLAKLLTDNFGVKDYNESNCGEFLLENISGKIDVVNDHLGKLDEDAFKCATLFLLELFITSKEFLNDVQKNYLISEFSRLKVLSKSGSKDEISNCYVSGEYTGHTEVEELIDEFNIDVLFISGDYLLKGSVTKTDWRILFKDLGCKSDHLNFIQDTLLPHITTLEKEELIKATKLIFGNRTKLEGQLNSISGFPIACRSGILKSSEALFNRKMLNVDSEVEVLWNKFPLDNEIDDRYIESPANHWTDFFNSIGVPQPEDDYPVYDLIEKIIQTTFDDVDQHLETFKLLCELFEQDKLSKDHLQQLRWLKLLTESDSYEVASELFLGKKYNPKVDFKAYASDDVTVISNSYLRGDIKSAGTKKFLVAIGLTESFKVAFSKRVDRRDLPQWFVSFTDNHDSYIKENAKTYSGQHYVGLSESDSSSNGYNLIPHLNLISIPELNGIFWNEILQLKHFRDAAFQKINYKCAFRSCRIPGYLQIYLSSHNSIPNLNNELCFATELYSHDFQEIVKDSNLICKVDFSNVLVDNEKLEDILGIRSDLDLVGIMTILQQEETRYFLVQNKIITKLKSIVEEGTTDEDLEVFRSFAESGKLLNQCGGWVSIDSLYRTEEGFELGIYNNPWLLHKDFYFLADLVGVKVLNESDFIFTKEAYRQEGLFKSRLLNRLKYVAYIVENENADECEQRFIDSVSDINFYQCSKITLAYSKEDVLIEKNDYDHIIHEEDFYFRGSWDGIRAASMFIKLATILGLKKESEQLKFREILLMKSTEILEYISELGFEIPEEWKEKPVEKSEEKPDQEKKSESQNDKSQGSSNEEAKNEEKNESIDSESQSKSEQTDNERVIEYNGEEEELMKKLFGDVLSGSQKSDLNLEAHIKALNYYQKQGYDISEAEVNFHENFKSRFLFPIKLNGQEIKVMCRSAVKGLLYFGAFAWEELADDNTELYMFLGGSCTDCKIAHSKSELKSEYADYWILRRNIEDENQKLDDLIAAENDKDQLQILFNVKRSEYTGVFMKWDTGGGGPVEINTGSGDEV